jgi:pyridoxine 4-dehydrogenase
MRNFGTPFWVGGDIEVRRLGFGAMRITGPRTWGPPPDPAAARALLRRAVELGRPADRHRRCLRPRRFGRADRGGPLPVRRSAHRNQGRLRTHGPQRHVRHRELTGWTPNGRPDHLRCACEGSLSRLRLDRIDLYQLHTPDPAVPFAESVGALDDLRRAGKIRHIGVSNVTLEQLAVARAVATINAVQNRLDLTNSRWRDMLTECESLGIGFIPYRPLRAWQDATEQALSRIASRHAADANQIALAWLLAISPIILPIPGTATRAHLEANVGAAALQLDRDEVEAISEAIGRA